MLRVESYHLAQENERDRGSFWIVVEEVSLQGTLWVSTSVHVLVVVVLRSNASIRPCDDRHRICSVPLRDYHRRLITSAVECGTINVHERVGDRSGTSVFSSLFISANHALRGFACEHVAYLPCKHSAHNTLKYVCNRAYPAVNT